LVPGAVVLGVGVWEELEPSPEVSAGVWDASVA
jgi:hypothetical protein